MLELLLAVSLQTQIINPPAKVEFQVGESLDQQRTREKTERKVKEAEHSQMALKAVENYQEARKGNTYIFGYCTYYVKQVRPQTPSGLGNAKEWPVNSNKPQVGGVMVSYESSAGHVGFITGVDGDYLTVSEMNYKGFNKISSRTLKWRDNFIIKGFLI